MKVYVWMCSLKMEYCVFATTLDEAKDKVRKLFPQGKRVEPILAMTPIIKDVPDLIICETRNFYYT